LRIAYLMVLEISRELAAKNLGQFNVLLTKLICMFVNMSGPNSSDENTRGNYREYLLSGQITRVYRVSGQIINFLRSIV